MKKKLSKTLSLVLGQNYYFYASLIIILFFLISLTGVLYKPLAPITAEITNRFYKGFVPKGEGFIEHLEALFWLFATSIFLFLFIKSIRRDGWSWSIFWYIIFTWICFVALGEEISWGQHLFGFKSPEYIGQINTQHEFNFHNLNISRLIGLSETNPFYSRLTNFTGILNPLFYLVFILLWFFIPLLKQMGGLGSVKPITGMPAFSRKAVLFCGISVFTLQIVDRLFFDVGEIFELAISLIVLVSALDLLKNEESFVFD